MKARTLASELLNERRHYPVGSPDWDYRTRAAWKLDQMHRGVPVCDWTDDPPPPKGAIPHEARAA